MRRVAAIAAVSSVLVLGSSFALPRPGAVLVLEIFLAVVTILALRSLLPTLGDPRPPQPRRWWRRGRDQTTTPRWLMRYQGLVSAATRDTVSADERLFRQLRQLAGERLEHLHDVDLEADPATARDLLGEAGWNVLRPDWAEGRGAWDPGATLEEIDAAVTAIEGL